MVQAGRNFAVLTALAVASCAPAFAQGSTQTAGALMASTAAASTPVEEAPKLPGTNLSLKTSDGWTLAARFHPAEPGHLTLILVHGAGRSMRIWTELARILIRNGYGVMAFDLRGHGGSALGPQGARMSWRDFHDDPGNNDFANMGRDIDAAAAYLISSGAAENSIGLIGEGLGGTLALRYAAVHPQAPLVTLIDPGLDYQNVPLISALRAYGSRPILLIYSQHDRVSSSAAPLIYAVAKISSGEQNAALVASRLYPDYLFGRTIGDQILAWLKNPVKPALSTSTAAVVSEPQPSSAPLIAPPAPQL